MNNGQVLTLTFCYLKKTLCLRDHRLGGLDEDGIWQPTLEFHVNLNHNVINPQSSS